jgi:hypothetical protein
MATRDEIKKTILAVADNPTVGEIYSLADKWADAIWKLDNPNFAVKEDGETNGSQSASAATRETRITQPTETR